MRIEDIYLGVKVKLEDLDIGDTWKWTYNQSTCYDRDLYTTDGVSLFNGQKHTVFDQGRCTEYSNGDVCVKLEPLAGILRVDKNLEIDDKLFATLKIMILQGGLQFQQGYQGRVKEIGDFLRAELAKRQSKVAAKPTAKTSSAKKGQDGSTKKHGLISRIIFSKRNDTDLTI